MKIVSLEAQNILRIRAIHIQADGKTVTLKGRNGSGKTSVLRCIEMALGGKTLAAEKPIHGDEAKGKIVLDLGEFIVTRSFTKEGTSALSVATKDGAKYSSPQAILDNIIGKLTFDPLGFARMEAAKQSETLKALVGLDFTDLDEERAKFYDDRTQIGRDLKMAEAKTVGKVPHLDVPAELVIVADLMGELDKAQTHNRAIAARIAAQRQNVERLESLKQDIAELEDRLADMKARQASYEKAIHENNVTILSDSEIDTAPIAARIRDAESINQKIRENAQLVADQAAAAALKRQQEAMTEQIAEIDAEKQSDLEAAKFPLPGLGFSENGVTLNGLPFAQASTAEQIRASAAIGIALNPKLRVLMIRDASLIDEEGLKMLAAFAEANDCQFWLEKVGNEEEVAVVIEEAPDQEAK